MDTPQEEEEDSVQPAPTVQKKRKKAGVGGTPATRALKNKKGKKGKKGKDGSNIGDGDGASGGEQEAAGPEVGRPTRQTRQNKCTSRIQPPCFPNLQRSWLTRFQNGGPPSGLPYTLEIHRPGGSLYGHWPSTSPPIELIQWLRYHVI